MSKKKNEQIYYCVGCGKTHPRGDFYVSYSPNHANGTLFYCKDFIKNESYEKDSSKVNIEKFQDMLRQLDLPFIYSAYSSSLENNSNDPVGEYFRLMNSLRHNRGLKWNDSSFEAKSEVDSKGTKSKGVRVTKDMASRWGEVDENYSAKEIVDLETFYIDMHNTHTIVTPQHEKALILICKLQLKLDQALENSDMNAFSKMHKEYQSLLQSSGLRPIDKVGGAEASGMRSFSQIFEEIEKDGFIVPAPIEEKQDIVDRTIQYIMNYTLKLLNQQALVEPPIDTPKVGD